MRMDNSLECVSKKPFTVLLILLMLFGIFTELYAYYNVNQVTRYADKWWNQRNCFYHACDNDCANFVSQCLIAGGFNLANGTGYGYNIYGRHSIVRAGDQPFPGLGDYLEEVVGISPIRDSLRWHEKWEYISSPHPYPNNYYSIWIITPYGAADSFEIHFSEFETEPGYDSVNIYNQHGNLIISYSGFLGSFWTPALPAETLYIEMVSDNSINYYGFDIDEYKWWGVEASTSLEPGDVIIFGSSWDVYKHVVIVVNGYGNDAVCDAHSTDHHHKHWYYWMDGTLDTFRIVTFFEIPFSAGGYHNLAYYLPWGWPAPLIVSAEPGNHEQDYDHIVPGQTYYIDWAIQSNGYADIPDTVQITLSLGYQPIEIWSVPGLWTGDSVIVEDYPYVFNGNSDVLSIKVDPWNYWEESNEGDNEFELLLTGICEDYVPPWDTLISPNGEEEFYAGGTCEITWVAGDSSEPGSQGITLQRLYYSPDNGDSWELIDELDGDLRSYTWHIPCDLATSECKVKIVVYDCASHTATDVSDGTFIVHGVASPTNLIAEAIAENAIALQWQDNIGEGIRFLIYRSEGDGDFEIIDTTGPHYGTGEITYADTGLDWNTIYRYKVQAFSDLYHSCFSNVTSETTNILNKPDFLQVSTSREPVHQLTVTWRDNSNYEEGYEIQRKMIESSGWTIVDTVADTCFIDDDVAPYLDYMYRVRAVAGEITSEFDTARCTASPSFENGAFYNNSSSKLIQSGSYLHLLYIEKVNPTKGFVKYTRSSISSPLWNEPITISSNDSCFSPAIAMGDNGELYGAWFRYRIIRQPAYDYYTLIVARKEGDSWNNDSIYMEDASTNGGVILSDCGIEVEGDTIYITGEKNINMAAARYSS